MAFESRSTVDSTPLRPTSESAIIPESPSGFRSHRDVSWRYDTGGAEEQRRPCTSLAFPSRDPRSPLSATFPNQAPPVSHVLKSNVPIAPILCCRDVQYVFLGTNTTSQTQQLNNFVQWVHDGHITTARPKAQHMVEVRRVDMSGRLDYTDRPTTAQPPPPTLPSPPLHHTYTEIALSLPLATAMQQLSLTGLHWPVHLNWYEIRLLHSIKSDASIDTQLDGAKAVAAAARHSRLIIDKCMVVSRDEQDVRLAIIKPADDKWRGAGVDATTATAEDTGRGAAVDAATATATANATESKETAASGLQSFAVGLGGYGGCYWGRRREHGPEAMEQPTDETRSPTLRIVERRTNGLRSTRAEFVAGGLLPIVAGV